MEKQTNGEIYKQKYKHGIAQTGIVKYGKTDKW